MVMAADGAVLRVLAKGDMNLAPGDGAELVTYHGQRLEDAKVVSVTPDGEIRPAEREFLLAQRMDEGIRKRACRRAYKVTLNRPVELPAGSLIASTGRMGNGFLVKGCDFGFNRSRGILVKASDGQVIDNKLTGDWEYAIVVCPEYWWLESGSSSNVVIRGNTIRDCRSVGVAAFAFGGPGAVAPAGAHRHIEIADNTILGGPRPCILASSVEDLKITGNMCKPDPSASAGWVLHGFGFEAKDLQPVMTTQCTKVVEKDKRTNG
jgi:hypothetical protein